MIELVYAPEVTIISRSRLGDDFVAWVRSRPEVERASGTPLVALFEAYMSGTATLDHIVEYAGRKCYRSWAAGRSHAGYIKHVLEERHGNVFEHATFSLDIAGVSRSLTHELVRHHTGFSVSQESQRFIDMSQPRFVVPPDILALNSPSLLEEFAADCEVDVQRYAYWRDKLSSTDRKSRNGAARWKLPNATETTLIGTFNLREFRNVLEQRGSLAADAEIRRLSIAMLEVVRPIAPHSLGDIYQIKDEGEPYLSVLHSKV